MSIAPTDGGRGGDKPSGVNTALEEVSRWKEVEERRLVSKVHEIDDEEVRVQDAITELQRQLENLGAIRGEIEVKKDAVPREAARRMHQAVLMGLKDDAALLKQCSEAYGRALSARETRIAAQMSRPGVLEKLEAVERFEEVQEDLMSRIPGLYRLALIDRHEAIKEELRTVIDALSDDASPIDSNLGEVTLIASEDVHVDTGRVEAVAIVLPIPFGVSKWRDWSEDLRSVIAYRVVGAISSALTQINADNAEIQYVSYPKENDGLFAVQVWLGDSDVDGDFSKSFETEIEKLCDCASELQIASINLKVSWQHPEVVAPGDLEED